MKNRETFLSLDYSYKAAHLKVTLRVSVTNNEQLKYNRNGCCP